jgi:hypothetical protein
MLATNLKTYLARGQDDTLLSREEAAAFLGVKPTTLAIWHCTKRYALPVVKVGRLAKYRLSDLRAFIDANAQ